MPRQKLTPAQRQYVRDLLVALAARHKHDWEGLMFDAKVPPSTAQAWRYGDEPTTPSASHLVSVLQASGLLEDLQAEQEAVTKARARIRRRRRPPRDGQAPPESKQ